MSCTVNWVILDVVSSWFIWCQNYTVKIKHMPPERKPSKYPDAKNSQYTVCLYISSNWLSETNITNYCVCVFTRHNLLICLFFSICRHVMFAPSAFDSYSDNSFPGIVDAMSEIENDGVDKWEQLKQQVSIATYTIQSAANTLSDIGL